MSNTRFEIGFKTQRLKKNSLLCVAEKISKTLSLLSIGVANNNNGLTIQKNEIVKEDICKYR